MSEYSQKQSPDYGWIYDVQAVVILLAPSAYSIIDYFSLTPDVARFRYAVFASILFIAGIIRMLFPFILPREAVDPSLSKQPVKTAMIGPRILDRAIPAPTAGAPGSAKITSVLSELYEDLKPVEGKEGHRLRITLHAPDSMAKTLVQIGRWRWDGEVCVSDTEIRIGTCSVGHAYSQARQWYVPQVLWQSPRPGSNSSDFSNSLRWCGLTEKEIEAQHLDDRSSFAAAPVICTDEHGNDEVIAVVSADTAKDLPSLADLQDYVNQRAESLCDGLLSF